MRGERTQLSGSPSIDLLVGGSTASNIDVSTKLTDALPIFLLVVVGLAFILLTFAFRTILVPITSILGFLLSIAAALGATVAVFQFGWGASLFGAAKSAGDAELSADHPGRDHLRPVQRLRGLRGVQDQGGIHQARATPAGRWSEAPASRSASCRRRR